MAELPHDHEDHPVVVSQNARRGLAMFSMYLMLFVLFLVGNVFFPQRMAASEFQFSSGEDAKVYSLGPNLAVIYGFVLIFAAIFLSLAYMRMTKGKGPK
jgi:hypothetical protein